MKKDMFTVKETVEKVLKRNKQCRNDDKLLIYNVFKEMKINIFTDEYLSSNFPSFESIRRTRQKIQASGKYPSDKRVKELRKKEKKEIHNNIGTWWDWGQK